MKKGLSVLLIVAALFGFYGGAVNLQDVLACMDYWEKEGEKSTADMNKLEDGLKQLQDNEQAYLDGKDQLAEGEKTLADGEAQYAQGLADYAAAPAKLAAGEEELAEGRTQLAGLATLIRYLSDADKKYGSWKNLYKEVKSDRATLVKGVAPAYSSLVGPNAISGQVIAEKATPEELQTFTMVVGAMASDKTGKKPDTAEDYIAMVNYAAGIYGTLTTAKETLDDAIASCEDLIGTMNSGSQLFSNGCKTPTTNQVIAAVQGNVRGVKTGLIAFKAYLPESYQDEYQSKVNAILNCSDEAPLEENAFYTLSNYLGRVKGGLEQKAALFNSKVDKAMSSMAAYALKYVGKKPVESKTHDGYAVSIIEDQLVGADGGQGYIATVMQGVASNVIGNKTLKNAVQSKMGNSALKLLRQLANTNVAFPYVAGTYDDGCTLAEFQNMMDTNPGIRAKLLYANQLLKKAKKDGQKTYNAGYAKYKQGLADYAAAPAKLADAEQQLADGRKQLEDGKAQLAQYEDGEQQVRDGLATLMSTEPSGGLESILDRRNGDDDFDNGDEHLDLAEGLEAVDVGRGYQADSGDLITAELVKRGAGTAAGIAAGVLALLAALLSFLKKNKGAAISACIAAIAAAGGAAVGTSAGTEFSVQAGSAVGVLPWAAAGVLAAVAVVFAVVHFSSPKEAK